METILAVVILFLLTSALIPMTHQLRTTLHNKKLEVHASEVALNGALVAQQYGEQAGAQFIDDVVYTWSYDRGVICIRFENIHEERQKCVYQNGDPT